MKISFLVTVHNEVDELKILLEKLEKYIASQGFVDEIVVLDDFSDNLLTKALLSNISHYPFAKVIQHNLDGDFGAHKTYGSRQCSGDWIVQLDADEYLADPLLENLHELVEANPSLELCRVPRINIVREMTDEDAKMWGWNVCKLPEFGDLSIINWNSGDYQTRIYKNNPKIFWNKKLHETIIGAREVAELPKDPEFSIIHDKTIDRQRKQNEFYMKNWSRDANMGRG